MSNINETQINKIRTSSRLFVRELGFLNETIAGTNYSASAVHAIIEIGNDNCITRKDLSETLLLKKTAINQVIKKLINEKIIIEIKKENSAHKKFLRLTKKGRRTLNSINNFAKDKLETVLESLDPFSRATVERGFEIYSNALKNSHGTMKKSKIDEGRIPYIFRLL